MACISLRRAKLEDSAPSGEKKLESGAKILIKPKVGYYDLYHPAAHVIYIGGGTPISEKPNFFFAYLERIFMKKSLTLINNMKNLFVVNILPEDSLSGGQVSDDRMYRD